MHTVSSNRIDLTSFPLLVTNTYLVSSTGKAARARELKKNREKRKETREVTLVKKDTRGIEKDIQILQEKKVLSVTEKEELARLTVEVKKIKDAKEEYLAKNPEHRKFVYPREAEEQSEQAKRQEVAQLATKRQPQRDPRRSVYYHEVFNPLGAPPPGMSYMEKSAEQWKAEQRKEFESMSGEESATEGEEDGSEEESEEDDEIMLPEGPPPPQPVQVEDDAKEEEDSSEDEDGIMMPKGPPPAPPSTPRVMQEGPPTKPISMQRPSLVPTTHIRPPLPPSSFSGRPPFPQQAPPMQRPLQYRPQHYRMPHPVSFVPPPPSSMVSGTSPAPAPGPPPARPPTVITSAPVLRDLKKEATAFVPTALRKKQAAQKAKAAKGGLPSAVNAAPKAEYDSVSQTPRSPGELEGEEDERLEEKVDLMSSLKPHFGKKVSANGSEDYKKFLKEVDDLL